jgi:hypothetical protein
MPVGEVIEITAATSFFSQRPDQQAKRLCKRVRNTRPSCTSQPPSQAMPVLTIRNLKTSSQHLLWRRNSNRRITVSADMYVEDDEDFGSNETRRRQKTNSAILSAMGIAQSVMDFEVRMGGEIRVEFIVTASLFDSRGNAMINGDLKLYEGTSESTGDLDGVRQFQLYIPAGATINHFVRVNNDDEGGDFATIALTVTNSGV